MGICGFTHVEVQKIPIEVLRRAIVAKKEHDAAPWHVLFNALFGVPTPGQTQQDVKVSQVNMTPEIFDSIFK